MAPKSPYQHLSALSKTIAHFGSIQSLLDWDQEIYMPSDGAPFRSQELAHLAAHVHKLRTSTKFEVTLKKLINLQTGHITDTTLTPRQQAAAREWRRDYLRATKLPPSFVKTFATTTSQAAHVWREARKENRFKKFAPHLEKIVALSRKKADLLGYQDHPYNALLDLYEPDMTISLLSPLFATLKEGLQSLVARLASKPHAENSILHSHFPKEKQFEFGKTLLAAMGFDPKEARLDLSTHPFCSGFNPKDTRMTTRIDEHDVMSNIFSVLHEGGHGLYNSDLPLEDFGTPLGEQVSLGIDESQSRWWETRIGRSEPFWKHFYPKLKAAFPSQLGAISFQQFYAALNHVRPSFIRVEADEVTYCLHVILRYELELGLMDGSIKVKEIPELWNHKMKESLHIVPETDAIGCLQDIHWSLGFIGYFPTYALGNLYAAQFFLAFEKQHPNWKELVEGGNLSFIREWLKDNIHQYGRQFTPVELIQRICHGPLSAKPYLDYLNSKYLN